jgi:hypothetical protein
MIAPLRCGMLVLVCLLPATTIAAADASVTAGRDALHRWPGYPWYDAQRDDVQPVKVQAPKESPPAEYGERSGGLAELVRVLAWTLLAAVLGVLVFLLLRAFIAREPAAGALPEVPDDGDADRIESLPFPVAAGRLDLLAEARRHYQAGNYGAAIVYLFSFQLVELDKRQIIRLAKGKTNRQYLREVGPRLPLRRLVEQTMVTFEDVFFGDRTLLRGRFESCWTRLVEFETLAAEA